MHLRAAFGFVVLSGSFFGVAPSVWGQDVARRQASAERGSPIAVLQEVLGKVDSNTMPCWCDKEFSRAAAPYVTAGLISAVAYGSRVAREKDINIFDAEMFTGRQGLHSVRIKRADMIRNNGESAAVRATLLINASDPKWPQPPPVTYLLRNVAGTWKVDDIDWGTGEASLKKHFLHPEG